MGNMKPYRHSRKYFTYLCVILFSACIKMAYLKLNHNRKHIVVLLGPSGCGKTTFGQSLSGPYSSKTFFSAGDKLREENYISAYREPNMADIKDFCYELISKTFTDFNVSQSAVLILDCVKDLADAEFVAAQANKYGFKIIRALLFDIDEKQLEQNWQKRADSSDMLRMISVTAREYLYKWRKRSNVLINYYTNLGLLSKTSGLSSYNWSTLLSCRICSTPNNLQFMLLESNQIKNVFARLHSVLNASEFQFSLPASCVHSYRDVKWVANPTRYYVTTKADGVRCLLLKISEGAFLITRKNEIYACNVADDHLPENTVLDGELLPSSSMSEIHLKMRSGLKTSVFLVFDVLALSGNALWKWPFSIRLQSMGNLAVRKDIVTVMKQASVHHQANHKSSLAKKRLGLHCVIKGHRQSTPDDIQKCLQTRFPYDCDGLVFTPDKAYAFGPDPLMFKWQSEDDVHCDVSLSASVFECRWVQAAGSWKPLFERRDKVAPNSSKTIYHLKEICQQPYTKENLLSNLAQVRILTEHDEKSKSSIQCDCGHPVKNLSYDELSSNLSELVELGKVGKTVDSATSLEVFSYSSSPPVGDPMMVRLSRGLVLHPPSKTVVTKPFVRFYEGVSDRDSHEIVEATIKYDGSLGIAFLWNGDVVVTTRRRMDSQQAVWANHWIKEHCNLTEFRAGYTYLFEIIYRNNTVVVNYLFEGLVLLAITDESGYELPYEEALHCARAIGFFMIAPRITGEYSEVLWYCGGIESSQETVGPNWPPFISGALPINGGWQEGWVVKFNDGSRQKVVYRWWKNMSKLAQLVHPQIVWLLIKHDKIKEVFGNAPNHFRTEIRRMVQAIGNKFEETLRLVERCFKVEEPNSEKFVNFSDYEFDDYGRNLEFALMTTDDAAEDNDRLRQLLNELKPYRLQRQVYKGTQGKSDINIFPFYHHLKSNSLRLPILNYICPAFPELEGYEPSDNFRQTWCKGWAPLSFTHGWQFVQAALQWNKTVPVFLQLPVEIIVMILIFLDHAALTAMAKVCVHLRKIVKSCKTNHLFAKKRKKTAWLYSKLFDRRTYDYDYDYDYEYSWRNSYDKYDSC